MINNQKTIKLLMQNRDPLKWPGGDSVMVEELSRHLNKLTNIKSILNYELYPNLNNIDVVMSRNMNLSVRDIEEQKILIEH